MVKKFKIEDYIATEEQVEMFKRQDNQIKHFVSGLLKMPGQKQVLVFKISEGNDRSKATIKPPVAFVVDSNGRINGYNDLTGVYILAMTITSALSTKGFIVVRNHTSKNDKQGTYYSILLCGFEFKIVPSELIEEIIEDCNRKGDCSDYWDFDSVK